MRYATFARWSNQSSRVHNLDARVKLLLLLAFVTSLTLIRSPSLPQLLISLLYVAVIAKISKLPVLRLLRMSLFVVPFVGLFSLIVYLGGDARRAWSILAKSYLSVLSVLVCISTTPVSKLIEAARYFRVPTLLLEVTLLTYRYLFVLSGQAQAMQIAFWARGGRAGHRAIQASSGMVAVLFSHSYEKAHMVHQAMLGRGYSGILTRQLPRSLRTAEIATLGAGLFFCVVLHFV